MQESGIEAFAAEEIVELSVMKDICEEINNAVATREITEE